MNVSKPWMKVVFIIVLLLIILPLVLFALIQFTPPVQDQPGTADNSDSKSTTTRERRAKRETRVVKEETVVIEPEPVWEIGAISTDPTRKTKQMTPYHPAARQVEELFRNLREPCREHKVSSASSSSSGPC